MTLSTPLDQPDTALLDRHGSMWDDIIGKLMFRSLPTVLSNLCTDCGEHLIVYACVRGEDARQPDRI